MEKVQTIRIPKGKIAEINLYITQTTGAQGAQEATAPQPRNRPPPAPPLEEQATEWKGRTLPVAKPPEEQKVDLQEALRQQLMETLRVRNEKKRLAGSGLRGGCFSKRCRC
jgi:hypothetical protein